MEKVNRRWTADELHDLHSLWVQGISRQAIADRFGRSVHGVAMQASRMGLSSSDRKSQERQPERKCLSCRRPFLPAFRHNYICSTCKQTPEWLEGDEYVMLDGGASGNMEEG